MNKQEDRLLPISRAEVVIAIKTLRTKKEARKILEVTKPDKIVYKRFHTFGTWRSKKVYLYNVDKIIKEL